MRSSTDPTLRGRCPRCWLLERVCVCSHVRPRPAPFDLVIVRHWKESWRSSNTGRLASLAFTNCRVLDYGAPGGRFDETVLETPGAFLLFPSLEDPVKAEPVSVDLRPDTGVTTLVVLDSTWSQARKLVRRIAPLRAMPRVQVKPTDPPPKRLRTPPMPSGMGTFEAISRAVEVLDGPEVGAELDALHATFVEHALGQRGGAPRAD